MISLIVFPFLYALFLVPIPLLILGIILIKKYFRDLVFKKFPGIKHPGIKHRNYIKSLDSKKMIPSSDDTQFWVCPHCGADTQSRKGKQFCSKCNVYL